MLIQENLQVESERVLTYKQIIEETSAWQLRADRFTAEIQINKEPWMESS